MATGGLSTNLKTLRAHVFLPIAVAVIGSSAPIVLSFILREMLSITALEAFSAGVALCSTSLGTTFTVLGTSGLTESRLGVVLISAAMLDDVVGLVMVQVISNLGTSSNSFNALTIVRPICVSIAFAVILPLVCIWVVKPLRTQACKALVGHDRLQRLLASKRTAFVLHTALLLGLVTGSSYAGTSNLFAAYIGGAIISWWDSINKRTPGHNEPQQQTLSEGSRAGVTYTSPDAREDALEQSLPARQITAASNTTHEQDTPQARQSASQNEAGEIEITGLFVYGRYYSPVVDAILKPFFFASIGFSIPITNMFAGSIVWRGFVYALLMALGKLLCGLCLVRFATPRIRLRSLESIPSICRRRWPPFKAKSSKPEPKGQETENITTGRTRKPEGVGQSKGKQPIRPRQAADKPKAFWKGSKSPKPRSLYPAAILGSAMVARGEIGFLISSVAESQGIYNTHNPQGSSELFLVVTWAILLCTIIGPVSVGLLVKRVRRLQALERSTRTGKGDPLGMWGLIERH